MCWACGDVFTQASSSSSPRNSSPASVISQAWSPQPVPLIATIETEIQGTRDGSLGFRPWWVCREAEQHRTFLCLFPRGGRLPVSVHAKLASPKVMWVNVAPQDSCIFAFKLLCSPFLGRAVCLPLPYHALPDCDQRWSLQVAWRHPSGLSGFPLQQPVLQG